MDSSNLSFGPVFYCLPIVFFGNFLLLNLLLVVIMKKFKDGDAKFQSLLKDRMVEEKEEFKKFVLVKEEDTTKVR